MAIDGAEAIDRLMKAKETGELLLDDRRCRIVHLRFPHNFGREGQDQDGGGGGIDLAIVFQTDEIKDIIQKDAGGET